VEIDVRSHKNGLYLSHDPFSTGESLQEWLEGYEHELLVVNVKEEGLENLCLSLLGGAGVTNFFFLDQSAPYLIRRGMGGARNGACRASDFESLNANMSRFCDWVWVDSFSQRDVEDLQIGTLKARGHKVCLVSPELHGAERIQEARMLAQNIQTSLQLPDAVCTKQPSLWGHR
jgi:hypothetical protein